MKTTLELPEDLMREMRIRAAKKNRKLKDVVAELIRRGLADPEVVNGLQENRYHVQFPLFKGKHAAKPEEEVTPERLAEILLEADVDDFVR